MAKTKQTSRQSTGGLAPRKHLFKSPKREYDKAAVVRCEDCGKVMAYWCDAIEDKANPGHAMPLDGEDFCGECRSTRAVNKRANAERERQAAQDKHRPKAPPVIKTIDKKQQYGAAVVVKKEKIVEKSKKPVKLEKPELQATVQFLETPPKPVLQLPPSAHDVTKRLREQSTQTYNARLYQFQHRHVSKYEWDKKQMGMAFEQATTA